MSNSVFCIVASTSQLMAVFDDLRAAGFSSDDVSVLMQEQSAPRDLGVEKHSKAPEGMSTGASAGAIAGGALGFLAGVGTLAIPGLGPFIAAGPVMAALSGAAVGGTLGGVTGGLIGLGLPEYEAKQYEGMLDQGHILVSVHIESKEEEKIAKEIMKQDKAQDINCVAEINCDKNG